MTMADSKRKIYNVDEDVLKRVVAGDTSALNELDGKADEKKETRQSCLQQRRQAQKMKITRPVS